MYMPQAAGGERRSALPWVVMALTCDCRRLRGHDGPQLLAEQRLLRKVGGHLAMGGCG